MLPEDKKQELLRQIKQEIYTNPNKNYYVLYKDYSDCKGTIYGQEDNVYTIITSSLSYVKQLQNNGFIVYIQTKNDRIVHIIKNRNLKTKLKFLEKK